MTFRRPSYRFSSDDLQTSSLQTGSHQTAFRQVLIRQPSDRFSSDSLQTGSHQTAFRQVLIRQPSDRFSSDSLQTGSLQTAFRHVLFRQPSDMFSSDSLQTGSLQTAFRQVLFRQHSDRFSSDNLQTGSLETAFRQVLTRQPSDSLKQLGIASNYVELRDVSSRILCRKLSDIIQLMDKAIDTRVNYHYIVPSDQDTVFLDRARRIVLQRWNVEHAFFANNGRISRGSYMLHTVMKEVLCLLRTDKYLCKRLLYYRIRHRLKKSLAWEDGVEAVDLVTEDAVDAVVDRICRMFECTRYSLHIKSSYKGDVMGKLKYHDPARGGILIDCSIGKIFTKIHEKLHRVTNLTSDANLILLVEKQCIFDKLVEAEFYNTFPCILVHGSGFPDIYTRLFLRRISYDLKLPIAALVDCDPHGVDIARCFKYGSVNLAADSYRLVTPDLGWLGLRPSDVIQLDLENSSQWTPLDLTIGERLKHDEFVQQNEQWLEELSVMVHFELKVGIEGVFDEL
ncbi:DNA topoisomerase 6 subunit A [Orobanche hederae]